MFEPLATIALGPLLLWQGWRVRRRVPRLPEPPGERQGRAGNGPALRLLIIGDSAAAGVGAAHQDEALSGRLVNELAECFTVDWRLFAATGETTRSMLQRLPALAGSRFDVAVTSLGVNDVTSGIGLRRWLDLQARFRQALRDRLGVRQIVVSGLPPMHGFPSLPQPLRWYLGSRATRFDRALRATLAGEPDSVFLNMRFTEDLALIASDGFHPGPGLYAEWGRRAAREIERWQDG